MRRFLTVLAATTLMLFAATAVRADITDPLFQSAYNKLVAWDPEMTALAPDPPPSGHDFAVGSQKVTQPNGAFQHVRVSAHSGPAGEDPQGSVRVTFDSPEFGGAGDLKGDVVCLAVGGIFGPGSATVAARLREPYQGNTHVTLVLFDNGNPGPAMGQSPDFAFIGFTSSPPANCSHGGTTLGFNSTGNIVVHDAT